MNALARARQLVIPVRPPLLALIGLAIAIAGLGLDAAVHLFAAAQPDHHHQVGFSVSEHGAHLLGLIGMVVALAGIVVHGVRTGRRGAHANRKET